jgi:hypothetical protein
MPRCITVPQLKQICHSYEVRFLSKDNKNDIQQKLIDGIKKVHAIPRVDHLSTPTVQKNKKKK